MKLIHLRNKRILVGVTGSIAAYKSADLIRRLREAGAMVRVVMTENAKQFITPLTMQAISGHPVHTDLFDLQAEAAMGHIQLARWADVILIAPATADFIASIAYGQANDLLTTLCLATAAPILIAPAMNQVMWKHPLTQANLQILAEKNISLLGVAEGTQACGDNGPGRMLEPMDIMEKIAQLFATQALAGIKIMVTAGPTHEFIDPVRYMTNGSSGKMGYALAAAASEAGAEVCLISGPVSLAIPPAVSCVHVVTAQEMADAVMRNVMNCDIFLSVAAVSDYRAQSVALHKIHKDEERVQLILERNPDIISEVAALSNKPFIVGFAAETENVIEAARIKRQRKQMNMIIANQVEVGMGTDKNAVTVISIDHARKEMIQPLPLMPKSQLARQLISLIAKQFREYQS